MSLIIWDPDSARKHLLYFSPSFSRINSSILRASTSYKSCSGIFTRPISNMVWGSRINQLCYWTLQKSGPTSCDHKNPFHTKWFDGEKAEAGFAITSTFSAVVNKHLTNGLHRVIRGTANKLINHMDFLALDLKHTGGAEGIHVFIPRQVQG